MKRFKILKKEFYVLSSDDYYKLLQTLLNLKDCEWIYSIEVENMKKGMRINERNVGSIMNKVKECKVKLSNIVNGES